MSVGYIKLYRQLIEWEWYTDSNTSRLFIHLLLLANYKKGRWRNHSLAPGQLITGRKLLAKQLSLSEQKIRTSLDRLKSSGEIIVKTTNKFSIITICNFCQYQEIEGSANQQLTNRQPASNQQITTSKKERRKKGKNKRPSFPAAEEAWKEVLLTIQQGQYQAPNNRAHKLIVGPLGGYERIGQSNEWGLKTIKEEFLRAYNEGDVAEPR